MLSAPLKSWPKLPCLWFGLELGEISWIIHSLIICNYNNTIAEDLFNDFDDLESETNLWLKFQLLCYSSTPFQKKKQFSLVSTTNLSQFSCESNLIYYFQFLAKEKQKHNIPIIELRFNRAIDISKPLIVLIARRIHWIPFGWSHESLFIDHLI